MSKNIKRNSSAGWLVSVIKYGLFACLFMPLIVHGSFIFPYIFPKQAFFQAVVEIIFALYLYLIFVEPRYRPRSSWLLKGLMIYFLMMVMSAIFGVNTYHSFWSNYERMAGVISILHYLAFLFLAAQIFKTKEEWHSFFNFSVMASFLEALYALSKMFGAANEATMRLDGTIGNPAFLAGYMLINAFFALWLMLEKKSLTWRIFYIFVIVLDLITMYKTQTRGAVLALVLSLGAMFLFFIFSRPKDLAQLPFKNPERLKKYVLAIFVFLFLAGVFIWLNRDSSFVKNNPTLNRVTHISTAETTAQTRLLAWRMSLKGFLERPILGWGMENYNIVFNKYYDPRLYPTESWFDRSHNAYLDVLVHTGLLGFVAYLFCAVLMFWFLWRAWRQEKIKYFEMAIFMIILAGYGVQNIFLFDTQVTLLMISLIISFIVFLSFSSSLPEKHKINKPNAFFIFLLSLLTFLSFYFFNLKPALASLTGIQALEYLQRGEIKEANQKFKDAYNLGTFGLPEITARAQDAALQVLNRAGSAENLKPEEKELVSVAVEGLKKALKLEPQNVRLMMMLGNVYLAAMSQNQSYLLEADLLLQKALELSPTRQEIYFALGQVRLYQGRNEESLELFQRAIDLNDKVAVSHWNFGILNISLGQKDKGEEELKKAISLGHSYKGEDIQQIIKAYGRIEDWQKIASLYQEWIDLEPENIHPYVGLATVYKQLGDKQQAKVWAEKAAQVDSQYKAALEQFIKELGI